MTLEKIRQAKTFEDLKPAIIFLTNEMHELSWGDFNAYRNTITEKAKEFGVSFSKLNAIAEQYRIEGKF